MSDEPEASAPIDLETLLPWSLHGTLSDLERARIRRAVEQEHLSQEHLEQTVKAFELAGERPDSATLAALAAGDLRPDEAEAVEAYLRREEASEDRELVALARAALRPESEGHGQGVTRPPDGNLMFWRVWAVAASLLALFATSAWWVASRPGATTGAAVSLIGVVELVPDDLTLRGGEADGTLVEIGDAGVSVVLVVERRVEGRSLAVSLRDEAAVEIARIEPVEVRSDGSIHLLVQPRVAGDLHRIVLSSREEAGSRDAVIHEYTFRNGS